MPSISVRKLYQDNQQKLQLAWAAGAAGGDNRIAVEADLAPGRTIGEVLAEIDTLPVWKSLSAGVRKAETGDAEFMTEMFEQFALAMGFGIMMVLVVLIWKINIFLPLAVNF